MSNPPKKLLGQPHPPSSTRILEMNPFSTSLQLSRDTNHLIFVVGVVGSHVKHIVYNTVLPPIKNSFDLRNTCFEVQIQVTFLQALQCNAIAKPQSEISAECHPTVNSTNSLPLKMGRAPKGTSSKHPFLGCKNVSCREGTSCYDVIRSLLVTMEF